MSTATEAPDKKTPPAPAEPPPITDEQLPHVNKFLDTFHKGRPQTKLEKVPAEIAAEQEPKMDAEGKPIEEKPPGDTPPAKGADKKPVKKPKPADTAPQPPPTPAATDYDKIAEATARGVTAALKADKPEKKEPEKPNLDFLSEDERAELPILEQMEKSNPDKYKGLSKKFTDAIKARQAYEAQWLKENPGREFDAEADEHNEFFEKNDVDWKDRDYTEALTDLKVSAATKKVEEKSQEEIAKLSAKDREREMAPIVASEAKRNGKALFTAVGGEFAKIVGENGVVNQDVLKALYAEDETRAHIVCNAANTLETYAAENLRLFNGVVKFDENNQVHKYLSDFAVHHETQMQQLPREESKDSQGRIFATAVEYGKMNKEQRAKHWTFSARDLNDLLAADQVKAVKTAIEADEKRLNAVIAKRGFKKDDSAPPQTTAKTTPEKKPEPDEKPLGVEGGDGTLLAHSFKRADPARGLGVNRLLSAFK